MATVGNNLKVLRERVGMSQSSLADLSGIDQSTISQIEAGKYVPRVGTLSKLADALNVSVALIDERLAVPPDRAVVHPADSVLDELLQIWPRLSRADQLRVVAQAHECLRPPAP